MWDLGDVLFRHIFSLLVPLEILIGTEAMETGPGQKKKLSFTLRVQQPLGLPGLSAITSPDRVHDRGHTKGLLRLK